MRSLYVVLAVAGCARAGTAELTDIDANTRLDSSFVPGDATPSDTACVTMTKDILVNGNFEGGNTGWMQTKVNTGDPDLIGNSGGLAAQSPAYRAWLGGVLAPSGQMVSDALYQDVAIPASTTALAITGYYEVRTQEFTSSPYDTAKVELVTTSGTAIDTIKTFDDDHATTAWTTFTKTITANVAGQTIRVKLSSTNDDLYVTNFYFDTLALTATFCQ